MTPASTWLEIDPGAITSNVAAVKQLVGPTTKVIVVVKANAYGHGLEPVGLAAQDGGVEELAVATLGEGIALRQAGVRLPILVLGSLLPEHARHAVEWELACTVCTGELAAALDAAADSLKKKARVEIKVDTGMGRLGVLPEELPHKLEEWLGFQGLEVNGFYSHLSSAEEEDPAYSMAQLARLQAARCAVCERLGKHQGWRWHLASSAGTVRFPSCRLDAVRVGLLAYGYNPVAHLAPLALRPAAAWKCRITFLKECPPGCSVSYGRTYVTRQRTRIATVGVGYGDGYPRALSNRSEVLIDGTRAPVVGRVCMDQMMVEVPPGVPARVGDEVVLMGTQGEETIRAEELADRAGTILHELLARLGTRMPRIYWKGQDV